jgi:tetratricopeptide (TPR) repeat protein
MNTTFITQLKSNLPEHTWPWVISALRQDELVWETLQANGAILQYPTGKDQDPESWNPARVAFLILQQPVPLPHATLSLGLRQRAFRTYEAITQQNPTAVTEDHPMARAALLAVALRERLRLMGKWDDLPEELSHTPCTTWYTPLACLYGLLEKPHNMLHAILSAGASDDMQSLAIHALLSNPLPPNILFMHLNSLMESLQNSERINFIKQLASTRPILATELARQGEIQILNPDQDSPLDDLIDDYHRAEIALIANDRPMAETAIQAAQDDARFIQASLAAHSSQVSETPLPFLQKAFELAPEKPEYRSRLALIYLENQNIAEANAIIDPSINSNHPDLLYASARLAYVSGEMERARQLATQALTVLETRSNACPHSLQITPSLTIQLARFLLVLNLPSAAIRAARYAIREIKDDTERLIVLGQAQSAAGQHMRAAEAYQWAVLMTPERQDLRRQLAEALEAAGEWALALEERKIIVNSPASTTDDQYALANCAVHNRQPAYTAELCRSILTKNPSDAMAHTLLGEAFAESDDLPAAQDQFKLASELDLNLPRPWLALARTHEKNNQPQKALETLRMASQAIPGSAEIQLALGENYLAANAPTQALSVLQRAAEIDPVNVHIALRYGETLYHLGHLPQAHQILKQAYQQDPTNIDVSHTYARILLGQDDPLAALPPLETVIASNPVEPEPFVDYARALLLTHREAEKATQALQHALELAPDHNEAQALLGEALAAANNLSASLHAYQIALETPLAQNDEWRARLSTGLGFVALHLGQIETAIAALLEAVQLDPQNYRPHSLLTEAYQTAGLTPDAYQSAREALHLAGDDIQVMIWYVEKLLEIATNIAAIGTGSSSQNPNPEELRSNAHQILSRAAEIAPAQAEILLRIATIEADSGDSDSATINLRRIATLKSADPSELQQAAQKLLTLHDAKGAVICLEKALEKTTDTEATDEERIIMLTQLASAYQKDDQIQSAYQMIEKALLLSHDDAGLCREKAQLLLELGQPQTAVDYLQETLRRLPDPRLHHTASIILQAEGKLLEALDHAEAGAQATTKKDDNDYDAGQLQSVVLAAELARALLQPERAEQILKNRAVNPQNPLHSLYHTLCAEMALEHGEEIDAANLLSNALTDTGSNSPRLLALQARLTARRGDHPAALEIFQTALQNLGEIETSKLNSLKPTDENPYPLTSSQSSFPILASTLYPLTEAAIELTLWGAAIRMAQRAVDIAPAEPLSHLNLARGLIQRAEYQYLCIDSDVVHHAPGPVALSEGTSHAFDQAIQDCLSICEIISQRSPVPAVPYALEHWQIRGNAVFHLSQKSIQSLTNWTERSSNADDLAASLAALRRVGNRFNQQVLMSDPKSAAVLTQIALSLTNEDPEKALKAFQMSILNEPVRNIHHAIRQYLLARLAYQLHLQSIAQAIQSAITLLPDEPRWFAQAATIALDSGDEVNAIGYLEKAIQLEPRYIAHHLALGHLYLRAAKESKSSEALQAVKILERACRLAPEHPEAWSTLAQAHRITGNLEQAAAAAERASTLAPEIAGSHLIQAEIALQAGKPQVAHDHAQTALHLQPDSTEAAVVLSRAFQALERPAEALAVIDKVIPTSEQTIPLTLERIKLLRQSQGPEIALQAAIDLTQNNPDDPVVLAILADAQAEAGQDEIAVSTAQKAILLGECLTTQQQTNLRLLLGQLLRRAGQLDQAIHHLDEAIRLQPEKIDALLELGRTHQDRRQQALALQMYRRAANIEPTDPRPYFQAGLALKEGKDYLESESMLRRAAELAPNDPAIRRQLAAVIAINLVHNPHRSFQTETV